MIYFGLQNVGSTTGRFRLSWNNYKGNDAKTWHSEEHMQPELFNHFYSEKHNGFLQDCHLTLIDKTDSSDFISGEEYWRAVGWTR